MTIFRIVIALLAIMNVCQQANAQITRYLYTGTVDVVSFDTEDDPFWETIQSGESFRGMITIDSSVTDNFPDNPSRGYYEMGDLVIRGISAQIGRHSFVSDLPAGLAEYHVVSMFNNFFSVDELSISTSDGFVRHRGPVVENLSVDHLSIILTDDTETMLIDDQLPFPAPQNLSSLSTNLFAIGGAIGPNNFGIRGHLTSIRRLGNTPHATSKTGLSAVPEPGALATVLFGVPALVARSRRRSRK